MTQKNIFFLAALLALQAVGLTVRGHSAEIGLLYALDEDWKAFALKAGGQPQVRFAGQRRIFSVQCGPHRVRAVKMGSGNIETSISTTALLATGRCDWVISVGPCGGLASGIQSGQVVLILNAHAWQGPAGGPANLLTFPSPVKPVLLSVAEKAGTFQFGLPPDKEMVEWAGVEAASGERFVQQPEDRAAAGAKGKVVEMNLLGAAGALANYNVPGIHLRVVSDLADGNASVDFANFVKNYDGRLGRYAWELIQASKADPTAPASYPKLRELVQPKVEPAIPAGKE